MAGGGRAVRKNCTCRIILSQKDEDPNGRQQNHKNRIL